MSTEREQQLIEQLRSLLETTDSQHVRDRLDAAQLQIGAIQRAADLDVVPLLRKDDLRELQAAAPPFGGLLGVPLTTLERIFQSPGPIYDPQGTGDDYWNWRSALRAAGFTPEDRVIVCISYHLTPAGQMFDDGARALGCTTLPAGIGNQEQQLALVAHAAVSAYIGLPSYLHALLNRAAEQKFELALRKAFVSAEPLPPSLREAIEAFGVTVFQGYGTADVGCIAYECAARDGMHVRADLLVSVCDPTTGEPLPTGETGEVVVTTLNRTYPLLRFGTGDLSALNDTPCSCGRTTPRLMGIRGRLGQGIKVRGLFVYPHQLSTVMAEFGQISAWSGVITRHDHRDDLTLHVAAPADQTTLDQLAARLQAVLKLRCAVVVDPAESLAHAPVLRDDRTWQ